MNIVWDDEIQEQAPNPQNIVWDDEVKPNVINGVAQAAGAGLMKGGAGMLQTAENAQKIFTGKSSKFQGLIDKANQYANDSGEFEGIGVPQSDFRKSIPGMVVEGAAEVPSLMTQVEGMGGGIPGLALQGGLSKANEGIKASAFQALMNSILGIAFKGVGKFQPSPEAGAVQKVSKLLTRMGISGAIGSGASKITGAENDQAVAQGILGAIMSGPNKKYTPEEIRQRAADLETRGQKITSEILQPPKYELSNASLEGGIYPESVVEAYKVIQPTKDYQGLVNQLGEAAKASAEKASSIRSKNNFVVDRAFLDDAQKFINEKKSGGLATDQQIETAQKTFDRYVEMLNRIKSKDVTRNYAQELKQELQRETKPLLEKQEKVGLDETENYRLQTLNKIRFGLKKAVENENPYLAEANAEYGGRISAQEYAAGQEANSRLAETPRGLIGEILQKIPLVRDLANHLTKPTDARGAALRMALSNEQSLGKTTSKIKGIREKVAKLEKMLPESRGIIEESAPSQQRLLTDDRSSEPIYIEGPGNRVQLPPGTQKQPLQLPKGQGFDIVQPEMVNRSFESGQKAQISNVARILNDLLGAKQRNFESGQKALVDEFGIPTYSNPRSSISESNIPKIDMSYTSKGGGKPMKKSIKDLLKRRGLL